MKREENQTVEYKESWHEKYLEWICGYANAKGGTLYVGIEDGTKRAVGVAKAHKLSEDIPNMIRDTMGLVADVAIVKKSGKDVIRIKVKPSAFPVSYHGGYFYRTGSVKMQLVGNALTEFILRKTGSSWDVAKNSSGKTVSTSRFTVLAGHYRDQTGNTLEDRDFKSFGLADDGGALTNAGALFADDSPVYQNRLFCTRWNGLGRSAGIMDATDSKEYSGSVLSLFEYGMNFVKMNSRAMWHKFPERRVDFIEYPVRAVEEAIANALIHRDYCNYGSEVHIDIYDDRLEVMSPGGMFDGGSPIQNRGNLLAVGSSRRNPVVADVFSRLDYAERRGSGLKKILDAYGNADYNCMKRTPTFASDTFFTVTLPSLTYGLTKKQLVASLMPPVVPPVMTPVATPVMTPVMTPVATPVMTPVMTPVTTPVAMRVDRMLSDRQKMILRALTKGDLSSTEIVASVNGIAVNNLRRRYLRYLLDVGYVEYTLPDKPNSRFQKYRLTADGKRQLAVLQSQLEGKETETINPHETIKFQPKTTEVTTEATTEVIAEITTEVGAEEIRRVVVALKGVDSYGLSELMAKVGMREREDFRKRYLKPAISEGYVEPTQPQSPRSPTQRYRLTDKGRKLATALDLVLRK